MDIEDELDEAAWAKRNGLGDVSPNWVRDANYPRVIAKWADGGPQNERVYLPPAEVLREHELRNHRDHPAPDAYDDMSFVPIWVWLVVFGLMALGFWWGWNNLYPS